MNKNKKWLIALSVATMITANGLVMAATSNQQTADDNKPRHTFADKRDFGKRGDMKAFHADKTELLKLLKIDEQTFKDEIKAGKTLVNIANDHGVSESELKSFMIEKMTNRINESVNSGRLTADKADKMKADMDKRVTDMINGKGPMHGQRPMHGKMLFENTKLLELLKVDAQTLKSEMKAGKTLVTIAKEHGVSEKKLKDFMVKQMKQHIEEGVKAGRISDEQAKKMKTDMDKKVSDMINGKGMMNPGHRPMHGKMMMENPKLLELLNIDADTLKSEMKAGKTLAAIAKEHGVSEQNLKAFMVKQMSERLDEGLKSGKITAERAEKAKANLEQNVEKMINSKGFERAHKQAQK
ncbi:hypothetical protein [Dendrosporobacter sp. 1207_IL3150]|uniref:hypothetical protein n=1 Tax=Dendrosporobacter sp. 1207_IL3150 TaxID=3084054 RepID=UPI002FD9941F